MIQFICSENGVLTFLMRPYHIGVATLGRIISEEVRARGGKVQRLDCQATEQPEVLIMAVTLSEGASLDWDGGWGREVAEVASLLDPIVHAPHRAVGKALVRRLTEICYSDALPRIAREWLKLWYRAIQADPAAHPSLSRNSERMMWFIADRISEIERGFPGLPTIALIDLPAMLPSFRQPARS